jgi:(R,R)-butanediol dehydrogenase/meso-butanediol dehydrogenase/diacetyl reductase
VVRFPAYCAVPLPDNVSDEVGAMLEPLAVGLHALDRGHARAGERLVVIGYGPVGAATALLGRSLGLDPLVCELSPGRLARAAAHGFETHAPEPEKRDFAKSVRGLTGGGAGIVVDCTGAVPALEAALEMSERGGRIVIAGIPKKPVAVDAGRMVLYERELIATLGYANDLPRVAAMIASGSLEPSVMITNRIALADVPAEIESLAGDPRDEVKVLAEVRS